MNKGLIVSCAAVAAAMMAFSGESLAQSSGPVSTETVEQWNTQLRDQIRQLEAEKDKVEQSATAPAAGRKGECRTA